MESTNFYKTKINRLAKSTNDIAQLRRLYKLMKIILKIDNEWILNQIERFIDNIQK